MVPAVDWLFTAVGDGAYVDPASVGVNPGGKYLAEFANLWPRILPGAGGNHHVLHTFGWFYFTLCRYLSKSYNLTDS